MARTKNKRFRRKNRLVKSNRGSVFVSPDGGETVYEQLPNGDRKMVEQTPLAKDTEQAMYEQELVGVEAIQLRRRYPALQKAWEQYKTVWKLVAYEE
jgi:photosystem II stability/assembly factor-like uncharacterized protein